MTTTTTPAHVAKRRRRRLLVLFPHSNLHTAKTRPALVVQADNLGTDIPQLIIAMITGRMFRAGHPSRVTVLLSAPEGQHSGLLSDSVVMTDNLATISDTAVDRVIGSLPTDAVDTVLVHTLGLKVAATTPEPSVEKPS
jgi:mRNA interferase MazF